MVASQAAALGRPLAGAMWRKDVLDRRCTWVPARSIGNFGECLEWPALGTIDIAQGRVDTHEWLAVSVSPHAAPQGLTVTTNRHWRSLETHFVLVACFFSPVLVRYDGQVFCVKDLRTMSPRPGTPEHQRRHRDVHLIERVP